MTDAVVFDESAYLELCAELGGEDTVEVLKIFLSDTSRKMGAIGSDLKARSTIMREGHSIKSSAGTLGFSELSSLAQELELRAESMDTAQLHGFLESLQRAFERVSKLAHAQLLGAGLEVS